MKPHRITVVVREGITNALHWPFVAIDGRYRYMLHDCPPLTFEQFCEAARRAFP